MKPIATRNANGLKARIAVLLEGANEPLTIGQIAGQLALDKTHNGEVSSALTKLRSEGRIKFALGPSTAALGPRYVKKYSAVRKRAPAPAPVPTPAEIDDRRFLSLCK